MLSKIELFNTAVLLSTENGALYLPAEFCFRVTITLPGRISSQVPAESGGISSFKPALLFSSSIGLSAVGTEGSAV